jgi:hypothetical protein
MYITLRVAITVYVLQGKTLLYYFGAKKCHPQNILMRRQNQAADVMQQSSAEPNVSLENFK